MQAHPRRSASAKGGTSSGGWSPVTPPARRPGDEIRGPDTLVEAIITRLRTRVRFPPSPLRQRDPRVSAGPEAPGSSSFWQAADHRPDHGDRSLGQDDRDGRAPESRSRHARHGGPRGGRARASGLRGRAIRQGLRLQRRALLAAARGDAADRRAASRPGWSGVRLLGRSPHARRACSRPSDPCG